MAADGDATVDRLFELLGNETRTATLDALWDAFEWKNRVEGTPERLKFAELQRRAGVSDSGSFNYHLGQLTGVLVAERDDGYALSEQGVRAMRAVNRGTSLATDRTPRTAVSPPCPFCTGTLTARRHGGLVRARCSECPGHDGRGLVVATRCPTTEIADAPVAAALDRAVSRRRTTVFAATHGVCSACSGRVDESLDVCRDHAADAETCSRCNRRYGGEWRCRCRTCGFSVALPGVVRAGYHALLEDRYTVRESGEGPRAVTVLLSLYRDGREHSTDPNVPAVTYALGDEHSTQVRLTDTETGVSTRLRGD